MRSSTARVEVDARALTRRCPRSLQILWFSFALSLPYYGGASGGLQFADGLLALIVCRLLLERAVTRRIGGLGDQLIVRLGAFVGWVAVANVGWYIVTGSTEFLLSATFAFHGFVLFTTLVVSGQWFGAVISRSVVWGLLVATLWQIVSVATASTPNGSRPLGTFNSPNQLGYFSLIVAVSCSLVLVKRVPGRLRAVSYATIPSALFLIVVSGTRAAVVGLALLGLCFALRAGVRPALLIPLAISLAILATPAADIAHEVMNRPSGTEDDGAGARGYDRLVNYPQWPISIGAGEGDYGRHKSDTGTHEIHSGLATIAFSYGLPGTTLFARFVWPFGKRALENGNVFLLALVGYNLFHQGLRFRGLWVLLGLAALFAAESASRRGRPEPPLPREAVRPVPSVGSSQ